MSTYRLIGKAYSEVKAREPYLVNSQYIADIGVISAEACVNSSYAKDFNADDMFCDYYRQDFGANRIMLEGHYLYDVLDPEVELSAYKLLILPDNINVDGRFKEKLDEYLSQGGKLLLSGKSGIARSGDFAFDFGIKYEGKAESQPAYIHPKYDLCPNGETSYIMYGTAYSVTLNDNFAGEVLCDRVESYFNRTAKHFCSHKHTPYDRTKTAPGVILTENIGYIGWDIFREYADVGALHLRSVVCDVINKLLGDKKTLTTTLGSIGITSLMSQRTEEGVRLVNHLLYAIPKVRGRNVEVIEDIPDVHNTGVTIRSDKKPKRVYTAPDGKELAFTYKNKCITYTVPKFNCSTLVIIEF